MSDLRNKLKAKVPQTITVTIDDSNYLVRGLGRSENTKFLNSLHSDRDGKRVGPEEFESSLLAKCVLDPDTMQQVMPDPSDWHDIDAATLNPLVEACMKVCGLDRSEASEVKN